MFGKNKLFYAYMLLFIAVFSWGINTVLAKGMILNIKPMALSFYRWLTALLFILPFGYKSLIEAKSTIKDNYIKLLILAVFSVAAYNSILYFSAKYTTATNMSFVTATSPAVTFIFSWLVLGEKAGFRKIAGMVVSLMGLMIIIFQGKAESLMALVVNKGDFLVLISVICWAFYSVLLKRLKIKMNPIAFLTILILFGLPCILPFYLWELKLYGGFGVNAQNLATLLFIGIFPSIISFICWNKGVEIAGPNIASMFMYLIPVVASFVAWIFLNESIQLYHVVGGITTFTGLYLAVYNGNSKNKVK
jgi:drug/metabolite transporter (DMT)-like permease